MDFLENQTKMNFPRNQMGDGFSWESNGGFAKRKHMELKKSNFFLDFLGGFAWIFSEIKRG